MSERGGKERNRSAQLVACIVATVGFILVRTVIMAYVIIEMGPSTYMVVIDRFWSMDMLGMVPVN